MANEIEKQKYITLDGVQKPIRFGTDNQIDMFKMVPEYVRSHNISLLISELQDYFNSMYTDTHKFYYTEVDI